ncbi:hypothetical protein CARUB_v10016659mg [Capsella rubella]|uniref:Serine/threonine-protein kinase PRP4 homolog n=1 Tax=Capsella rubella TaxID=81985 RepID=R0HI27_9BRAS|nr:serine/threonine-protein kinase prpf4B isoform X2 [Capsella rubella]EOA23468.1 hypothetical protein CARUB_v10016659mg [Capsella rubella]
MANDKQIESHHRKHHRPSSSSEETDKSSKRHKHRHHKHHHHRHHRHHRDKKRGDEIPSAGDEIEAMDVTEADPIGVSNGREEDVEEGEILEEGGLGDVLMKPADSDGESGEIKSDQFRDNDLPPHGEKGRQGEEDKRWCKEAGDPLERVSKRRYENGRSSFSPGSSEEKHKSRNRSPSNSRQSNEVRARSRSKSHDRDREISRARIVAEDEFSDRGKHRGSSRDYHHDRVDSGRTEERYHRLGRYEENDRQYSRDVLERERSKERDMDREGSIRDRDSEGSKRRERDSDRRRDREREKRREIEVDREMRKEKEREGSIDRRREREGDYLRDRDNERGRSRDRTRYSSRESRREKERVSEKDREKGREIQTDREKYRSSDVDYSEMRHGQSRHSRYDAIDDLEMRRPNSLKAQKSKDDKSEETRGNNERSRNEDDQDDNDEGVVWKSPEEEEEELNRIKEESRKRMEAILEKHKKKPEQQNEPFSQDKGKDVAQEVAPKSDSSAVVIAANVGQAKSNLDADADKASLMAPAGLGEGSPKSERSADMFHDDIFGESPAGIRKVGGKGDGVPMVRSGLHDNWDDAEGYYSYQFGELLDGRYEVIATHGKGVFSTVVRAKDLKAGPTEPEEVAIKIIRNNETMHKAGKIEVQILKKLAGADRDDRRHCVRFISTFKYRNHLCLVFESLHLNLREVLKKFGRNIGLQLSAVRAYSKQLFIALKHLKNCGVLHCDIKPDNMLVNEGKNVLKLCDFGNAMFAGKNEVTPYLVSRFYRSPEIILGLAYDHPLDIWSVGCCLYELYSGKVLFPGATNNDMLRLHMELKGPFPKKMLRKGAFIDQHFDQDLNFYATEEDTVSGKLIKRMIANVKPKDFGSIIKGYPGEDPKILAHFRDLLDKIFILDPERRLTVSQALAHPFITGK